MSKNTFNYSVGKTDIKIFRTGKSMRLESCVADKNSPESVRDVHYHFTYEAFFVGNGSLEIITDSQRTVYERKTVIIPPKLRHYTLSEGDDCYCLLFSADGMEKMFGDEISVFDLSDSSIGYIRSAAAACERGGDKAHRDAELLVGLVFNEVMENIGFYRESEKADRNDDRHINAIEQYINANVFNKITMKDLSRHIFLSTRQISRIIFAEYGCSLSQLVKSKKLDAAEMLIKNTDIVISAVASQVNIGSDNYFYAVFKKKYGMSPLQYRKKYKKSSENDNENI